MNPASNYNQGLIVHKKGIDLNILINMLSYLLLLANIIMFILTRNDVDNANFYFYYSLFTLIIFGAAFTIHLLNHKSFDKNNVILIILLVLSLLLSSGFNGFRQGRLLLFIVFFGNLFLYSILPRYKLHTVFDRTTILFCLCYSVLPVIIFLVIHPQSMLSFDGSFQGFSTSHSGYGYIAGAAMLILIIRNSRWKYFAIPFVAYGLIIAESRASIIAAAMASIYILIDRQKRIINKLILFAVSAFLIVIGNQIFSQFTTRNTEESYLVRMAMLSDYVNFIKAHPVWGYGGDYTIDFALGARGILSVQAHNAIIQTWANYGIIVLIVFSILIIYNIRRFNTIGRSFFLYIVIIGLFQPEFGVGIGPTFSFIIINAIYYSQREIPLHEPCLSRCVGFGTGCV